MEKHPNVLTTDDDIDAALQQAKAFESFPTIVEAEFHRQAQLEFLRLKLSDGQVMLIPSEMLDELDGAAFEQVQDVQVVMLGLAVWWPRIDDGLYLPDFLEHRWGKVWSGVAA